MSKKLDFVRDKAPILAELLASIEKGENPYSLDGWIYNAGYAKLGALLSEIHCMYSGGQITQQFPYDGHNAFEEFVCDVLRVAFELQPGNCLSWASDPKKIAQLYWEYATGEYLD